MESAVHSSAVFALRVVLAGQCLLVHLMQAPQKQLNFFMEIFSAVLGCREVSAGWKTNSRSSCEGVSKASLDSLRGSLRNKILEESEEDP